MCIELFHHLFPLPFERKNLRTATVHGTYNSVPVHRNEFRIETASGAIWARAGSNMASAKRVTKNFFMVYFFTNSTRRFLARPSSVLLEAMGSWEP